MRDEEVAAQIDAARIVVLLVSRDFLASDDCYDVELKRATSRGRAGAALVVPLIVRACDWQAAEFGDLQALPRNGIPVAEWPSADKAWLEVVRELRKMVLVLARGHEKPPRVPDATGRDLRQRVLVVVGVALAAAVAVAAARFGHGKNSAASTPFAQPSATASGGSPVESAAPVAASVVSTGTAAANGPGPASQSAAQRGTSIPKPKGSAPELAARSL